MAVAILTVAPSPANVSEPVTVANRGSDSTRYNATLRIDGRVVAFETGRLAADERTRITFDHRFGTAGEHVVAVGSSSERTVSVSEGGTATVAGMVLPDEELREEIQDYRDRTDRELPAHAYVLLSRAGPYVLFTTEERQPVEMAVVTGDLPGETIVERGRSVPVLIARETRASGTDATTQAITDPSIASVVDAQVRSPGRVTSVNISADNATVRLQNVGADAADTGSGTLARVTVRGDADGTTPVRLTGENVYADENGAEYDVTLSNATLLVGQRRTPDVTGDGQAATDVDGDGKLEDVTALLRET